MVSRAEGGTVDPLTAKQQYESQLQQQYAQDQQLIPAPKDLTTPPPATPCALDTAPAGISASQGGPGPAGEFQPNNQWSAPVAGSTTNWYLVWAGQTGVDSMPQYTPAVAVYVRITSPDGCSVSETDVGTFTDQQADGPFTITAVNGVWITLQTPTLVNYYFSLTTDQFTQSVPAP
jgi:hypothetical protein